MFNIKVGTAITVAIADGSKADGALADVTYIDAWEQGLFPREAKLSWLEGGAENGRRLGAIQVVRGLLDNFKPAPFDVQKWPSLRSYFTFAASGLESKRDHVVYDLSKKRLRSKLLALLALPLEKASEIFNPTGMISVPDAKVEIDCELMRLAAYRPLDFRWHYPHPRWNDRLRTEFARVWGTDNVCVFALPNGTNAGPGAWVHARYPDRHSFRGSYGGYAFPLHDRRAGHDPSNLSAGLLEGLALAYHAPVQPQDVFDAILALLSATSYTLRFAEDLEDVFPHVPFPADRAVFEQAAAVGKLIREVETFERAPLLDYLSPAIARIETAPHGPLAEIGPGDWDEGSIVLCENGSGKVSAIPAEIWRFAVSGYPLLPRWLAGRKGVAVDDSFLKEFRDITGRINELIHRFNEADLVLEQALTHSLSRDELGLAPTANESPNEKP